MESIAALAAGLVAGLALAVPLGAIGVLLIQEGVARGRTKGFPAAAAVATVDTLYCAAAVGAGSVLAPAVATWAPWPQVIGGLMLAGIAARGLAGIRRQSPATAASVGVEHGPSWRRYALFLGLTAVNPATLIYFAAVVTGLSSISRSVATAVLFVTGVTVASLTWQYLLVVVGAVLRRRAGARLQRLTTAIGNGVVGLLGALMIVGATL